MTRAAEGAWPARRAGLAAEPLTVEADGPVWEAIVETADHRQAAVIVLGSRGLTGLRSILLGVSPERLSIGLTARPW